jgi:hypothetical protein
VTAVTIPSAPPAEAELTGERRMSALLPGEGIRVRVGCALLSVALLPVVFGCATRVPVPPRVDLGQWDTIGIVDFGSGGDPALGRLATSQFVQMLQDAQPAPAGRRTACERQAPGFFARSAEPGRVMSRGTTTRS